MKRVLEIALVGVLSLGAVTAEAQDNRHGNRDGREQFSYVNNRRHDERRDWQRRDDRNDRCRLRERPTRVHYRGR